VLSSTSTTSPVIAPQNGIASGQGISVSGITSPSTTVVQLLDNSSPRQTATVTIDCSGSPPPPTPSALVVTPQSQGSATASCVGQTYTFVISGGTAPYSVFFQSPKPGATITPTSVTFVRAELHGCRLAPGTTVRGEQRHDRGLGLSGAGDDGIGGVLVKHP
jgi:hypothetical protein